MENKGLLLEAIFGYGNKHTYHSQKALNQLLDNLKEREVRVLTRRFGLQDGQTRTLKEIGKEFDVTPERIRQVESKALRKLRFSVRQSTPA